MKKAILFLSYFYLISILFSCGSRKTETSISEHEKQNDVKTESTTNLNYKFDKASLEPFDPLRPMILGGKEYRNTRIVHHYEEGQKQEQTNIEDKSKEESFDKEKSTDRDNTKLFAIIGLGIIGAMFFFFLIVIFGMLWYFKSILNPPLT